MKAEMIESSHSVGENRAAEQQDMANKACFLRRWRHCSEEQRWVKFICFQGGRV